MQFTKAQFKILKYIYKHPYVSVLKVKEKFKDDNPFSTLMLLSRPKETYINFPTATCKEEDNGYYEKLPTTLAHCICTDRGSLEVETNLFNWKAFLFSKVADVIAAVITSLITCYLFLLLHLSS